MKYLLSLATVTMLIPSIVSGSEYKIQTASGISHGYVKNGVINWDDIPYAKPPIGDLRWMAPQKLDTSSRENYINAIENNFCVQEPSGLGGSSGNSFFSGTEDCLYLDIKKPKK